MVHKNRKSEVAWSPEKLPVFLEAKGISICLSIYKSFYIGVSPSIYLSIFYLSLFIDIYIFSYLFNALGIGLPIFNQFIYFSLTHNLFIYLKFVCISVFQSVNQSVYISITLFIYQSKSQSICIYID